MKRLSIAGIVVTAIVILATIYLYNRFAGDGKSVANLGVKTK